MGYLSNAWARLWGRNHRRSPEHPLVAWRAMYLVDKPMDGAPLYRFPYSVRRVEPGLYGILGIRWKYASVYRPRATYVASRGHVLKYWLPSMAPHIVLAKTALWGEVRKHSNKGPAIWCGDFGQIRELYVQETYQIELLNELLPEVPVSVSRRIFPRSWRNVHDRT